MLVLTRRCGESINMTTKSGEEITVSVNTVNSGQVRLGITAPQSVHILRDELIKTPKETGHVAVT